MPADQQMHLFFIFTDIKMPDQQPVTEAIIKGIGKLLTVVKKEAGG